MRSRRVFGCRKPANEDIIMADIMAGSTIASEDEPCSGRHATKKRPVEDHKHHMSCLDTSVTNDPCLVSSITHDDHKLITNATLKHTGRSQIQRAASHHVQAIREQRIEEQELALDRGEGTISSLHVSLYASLVSQL